ncbi:GNAT family N-acetyltransferase [Kitasatospora acidiphila]|uniref:GNAT family N-acetyltransferase n=1 Tax=Kitasatospora acidiphila TaxID=2567942 RepID=A0A540WAT0_9ACTN|nr:GNAT family N-acetyltransferase [Kitasatospora acidiphila]TQF06151.1 GNAT family N-acetyltransferase [Kitasatospora acidiphila]
MTEPHIRAAGPGDRAVIARILADSWGSTVIVVHGDRYDALELPALLAERDGEPAGLLTYRLSADGLEVVSLDALHRGGGTGSALLAAAIEAAGRAGAARLWLVTTNDNLDALRFYQRRGLRITAVNPGAVDRARTVKPAIPLVGEYGIPLHDKLVLELRLPQSADS